MDRKTGGGVKRGVWLRLAAGPQCARARVGTNHGPNRKERTGSCEGFRPAPIALSENCLNLILSSVWIQDFLYKVSFLAQMCTFLQRQENTRCSSNALKTSFHKCLSVHKIVYMFSVDLKRQDGLLRPASTDTGMCHTSNFHALLNFAWQS